MPGESGRGSTWTNDRENPGGFVCTGEYVNGVHHRFDGTPCTGSIDLDQVKAHTTTELPTDLLRRLEHDMVRKTVATEAITGLAKHLGASHVDIGWPGRGFPVLDTKRYMVNENDWHRFTVSDRWVVIDNQGAETLDYDELVAAVKALPEEGDPVTTEVEQGPRRRSTRPHLPLLRLHRRPRLRRRLERVTVRLGLAHYAPDGPDDTGVDRYWQSWPMHNLVAHPVSEVSHQLGAALHRLAAHFSDAYMQDDARDTLGNRLHDATLPTHEEGTGRG